MFCRTKTSKGNGSELTFSLKKEGEIPVGNLPHLVVSLKKQLPIPMCFGDTNVCGLTIVENARIYSPPGEY